MLVLLVFLQCKKVKAAVPAFHSNYAWRNVEHRKNVNPVF
jgi:hypothetical protein